MTEPSIAVGPPTATPRPWTVDIIEGGGWAVVVDADDEQAKVIAELDDTYGDRAANASLIVEAVNAYGADNALNAKVRQRITQAFDGEYSESEALRAFAEDGWPVDWPDVRQAQAEYEAAHPLAVEPDGLPLDVPRHRVVSADEHDSRNGMFHGCCAEDAEPWPCSVQRAVIEDARSASHVALRAIVVWDGQRGTPGIPRSLRVRARHALRVDGTPSEAKP